MPDDTNDYDDNRTPNPAGVPNDANFLRAAAVGVTRGELPQITPITTGEDARNIDHTITGAALLIAWMQLAREQERAPERYGKAALIALDELSDDEIKQVVADLGGAIDTIDHVLQLVSGHMRLKRPKLVAKLIGNGVSHMIAEALAKLAQSDADEDAAARTRPIDPNLN